MSTCDGLGYRVITFFIRRFVEFQRGHLYKNNCIDIDIVYISTFGYAEIK